jgi:putative transposase
MADYRRWYVRGGTYFFTLVTANRAPIFNADIARQSLHDVLAQTGRDHPFRLAAMALLPDHLHMIWTLPTRDDDFSVRLAAMKANFSRAYLAAGGAEQRVSESRARRGNRGVWQRRFYEHLIRDEDDLINHFNYIHYNPVKHGLASCPHAWPYTSFHRCVESGLYEPAWGCSCGKRPPVLPDFTWANEDME